MSAQISDFVGREVACRSFGRVLEEWEKGGLSGEVLVAGSGCSIEQLYDRHQRISWDSYRAIMANARRLWDDDGFVQLGLVIMDTPWAKHVTIPARLLTSPRDLYRWMARPGPGVARRTFTCIDHLLRDTGPHRLELESRMQAGYPPCPEYFLVTLGALRAVPTLLGLAPAEVTMEAIDNGARYDIRTPAAGGTLAWLWRATRWPFTARAAARELEDAQIELYKRNQELEAKAQELELQNSELERYAYTVSHDLKSPLVTIKGFLGVLEKDALAGDSERLRHDIAQIGSAVDAMGRFLTELLELSRVGRLTNPPEQISLTELADEVAGLLGGEIGRRRIELVIQPRMPPVFGDRVRIREVLQNLVDNAIRFAGEQPAPRIEIGAERDRGEVTCFVRDNGVGVPPRFHHKIFGLFERLETSLDGTGIGLALVKRIVEVHGGRVWVESAGTGDGATFSFTLPATAPDDGSGARPPGGEG